MLNQDNTSGLKKIAWGSLSSENFWQAADKLQDDTLQKATKLFAFVSHADTATLQNILIQYRFFTIYYIADLALLVAKLKNGKMRSFLADILSDELGCGDSNKAHPNLYDDFLMSIGVGKDNLDSIALKNNIKLLDDARTMLVNGSDAYGIGLRGMGGECVCQVYISLLHEYLTMNPYVVKNKDKIDWTFWDLHVGEHDVRHREETRDLINQEIVLQNGHALHQLGKAYGESMRSWESFWNNIFHATVDAQPHTQSAVVEVQSQLDFHALVAQKA